MTSLLVSLFIALGLSALSAGLSVRVVDRLQKDRDIEASSRIAIWQMARLAALAPLAMALVFSVFPQTQKTARDPTNNNHGGNGGEIRRNHGRKRFGEVHLLLRLKLCVA